MVTEFYTRHKGPYQLQVCRLAPTKKHPDAVAVETLHGTFDGEDCAPMAQCLLTDPRDSVTGVYVWSVPEAQHVMTYNRRAFPSQGEKNVP